MREISIGFLILILLAACGPDDDNAIPEVETEFILAGQVSGDMNHEVYEPELEMTFENAEVSGVPTAAYHGKQTIDLDGDEVNDIFYYAFYGVGSTDSGIKYNGTSKGSHLVKLNNSEVDYSIQGLSINDTISGDIDWQPLHQLLTTVGFTSIAEPNLSGYNIYKDYNEYVNYNYWSSDTLYMALRMRHDAVYKYGWINLYIEDYCKVKIKEFAFEQ